INPYNTENAMDSRILVIKCVSEDVELSSTMQLSADGHLITQTYRKTTDAPSPSFSFQITPYDGPLKASIFYRQ
ncbi:MAG: hypothetical protein KDD34_09550, partial [Bdellovibrionales bacterium]|nr:hypothetical protein [Bdellovibrionales bacterium]